jgi:hypothetical protein
VGFEPTVPVKGHWFSRPARSTTLSPLRRRGRAVIQAYASGSDKADRPPNSRAGARHTLLRVHGNLHQPSRRPYGTEEFPQVFRASSGTSVFPFRGNTCVRAATDGSPRRHQDTKGTGRCAETVGSVRRKHGTPGRLRFASIVRKLPFFVSLSLCGAISSSRQNGAKPARGVSPDWDMTAVSCRNRGGLRRVRSRGGANRVVRRSRARLSAQLLSGSTSSEPSAGDGPLRLAGSRGFRGL